MCQEYSMRAVMGECVECISEPVANQVSLIGHGCSQRSCECNCSVCVCAVRHGPSLYEHFSLVCLVLHASLNTE